MRDHHDRDSVAVELGHQRHHAALLAVIQSGGRLVENQQARAQREHARDRQPLALALAEQEWIERARILKSDRAQHLVASALNLVRREVEVARTEGDLVLDGRGENLMVGVLEDVADLGGGFGRAHRGAVAPVEHHGARDRMQQAHQMLGQRGLARAVLADDRDELARRDPQIDRIEHRRSVGVVEAERAHLDQRICVVGGRCVLR